jgi:hypothetical protein
MPALSALSLTGEQDSYTLVRERERERERQKEGVSERDKDIYKGIERGREREKERERNVHNCYFYILKRNDGCLGTF